MCTIYHHINNHMNHIISWLALVISCPSSMCLSESRGIWWHWRLSFTCRGRIRKSRASLLGFTRLVHVFHFFHSWWLRSYRIGKKKKTCEKREKHVKNLWNLQWVVIQDTLGWQHSTKQVWSKHERDAFLSLFQLCINQYETVVRYLSFTANSSSSL